MPTSAARSSACCNMADGALLHRRRLRRAPCPRPASCCVMRYRLGPAHRAWSSIRSTVPTCRPRRGAVDEVFDLMVELECLRRAAGLPRDHTPAAVNGYARMHRRRRANTDMIPLLDTILSEMPAPDCGRRTVPVALQVSARWTTAATSAASASAAWSVGTLHEQEQALVVKHDGTARTARTITQGVHVRGTWARRKRLDVPMPATSWPSLASRTPTSAT